MDEKKRSSLTELSMENLPRSGYRREQHSMRRASSPPAQSYFDTAENGPHPISPDAGSHFAYSTTLRRHESPTSTVDKIMHWSHKDPEEGIMLDNRQDTPSARYASMSIEACLRDFHSDPATGLASSSIPALRATYGYNEFSVSTPEPAWLKFAKTIYESHLILLLFGSAAISALLGNFDDAVSITVAILIVVTVGYVQERRSEESLAALNKLVPHHCHILRDGHQVHLLANELVPGDIVTFQVGDRIPADIRILNSLDLEIDESSLTGETRPARKSDAPCPPRAPLGERTSIAFMGTLVRNGRGTGLVVSTGATTEFGSVFTLMQSVEEKRTPLQASMDELAHKLSVLSFGVIGVICVIGVVQQRGWLEMFTIGVSLAVAAIPEGLPIVTTVTLALGVLRMARRKAIVKKLPSVEALGSVSTLTKNEQTVIQIFVVDHIVNVESAFATRTNVVTPAIRKTLEIGGLCNNAFRNSEGVNVGQSTDVAMLNVLAEFGVRDERRNFTRSFERSFNSETKYMAITGTHHTNTSSSHSRNASPAPHREIYYIKGALDVLLPLCKTYHVADDATPPLEQGVRQTILSRAEQCAKSGLRVVGVGYAHVPAGYSATEPPANLVFAGFEAMLDPPRKGVSEAVAQLHAGGVKVVMITGDAVQTALSIANSLGLRTSGVGASTGLGMGLDMGTRVGMGGIGMGIKSPAASSCLTGAEIDEMDDRALMERVSNVTVFARTTPRHKMRIVKAYQCRGEIVAMTGDGVNDAPALKMADIGVSMGKSGTDVAKEAADVILVDDNFATILSAVEEGKHIFYNIQNFLSFQLSTAVAALTLITLSTMFRMSNPLNAMQILFINILMDGPPSQSLGVDPVDHAVMRRPPRKKDEPIITRRIIGRVLFSASIIVFGTLFVYAHELSDGRMSRRDQTMTFTCFVFLDLASALQNRGINCSLLQNRMLLTTVSVSFLVQLAFIYFPLFQSVFQTEALAVHDLSVLLCLGGVSMGLHELRRRWERKANKEMDALYAGGVGDVV
ncbi:ATPase, Ca++ transporting, type 2C, member 2 [Ceratobasidium theobromae]|uniref:P-type Ca(2+) transporter n=1 Tax=Ceratobasidium theobromae TaxID=1582974 RepID=A0A5N5QCX6_9AGAM|nr:ATPase, Ca++ transporting, type 2C, member 2 [Ceratobasidium theobromae]